MCGICGFTGDGSPSLLRDMLAAIAHRGPDAEGVYQDDHVHLGNRRLAIIDIDGGDQPVTNESGSVVVVFNGEIYNFRELRADLVTRGHRFQSASDTEVLVHLYEEYGDDFPCHLNGMFVFALWDEDRRHLLLARDPVGIKPLLYWWNGRTLVFGSEAKAILKHPVVTSAPDFDAVHLLLNLRFVPSPHTLFQGISKLPAGHRLTWDGEGISIERYWQWDRTPNTTMSDSDWADQLRSDLDRSVRRHMVADVPVGAFLSGGIDSSAIVAHAVRHTSGPLKTFTLGFNEPTDELDDAQAVADWFHTDHYAETLHANPLADFPLVTWFVEEPKVNAIQGYHAARMAARHTKVVLSGLGGDELFAGYDIHRHLRITGLLGRALPGRLSRLTTPLTRAASFCGQQLIGPRFENARRGLEMFSSLPDQSILYGILRNAWDTDSRMLKTIYTDTAAANIHARTQDVLKPQFDQDRDLVSNALWVEFQGKMVDDFLHNEDRVSMAHSLETRVPFLDRDFVTTAWKMPLRTRFGGGTGKRILRSAMRDVLPECVLQKPKWGFTFSSYHQFRKDLRPIAQNLLNSGSLDRLGLFNADFLRSILEHRPSPLMRWHYFLLWMVVGLHFWCELFLDGRDPHEISETQARITA